MRAALLLPLLVLATWTTGCVDSGSGMRFEADSDGSDDMETPDREGPPLVLMITTDALNRDYIGLNHPEWNTTPNLDSLLLESTRYENVLTTRGLTAVALGSVLTGAYPKTHGIRSHDDSSTGQLTLVQERFQAAGWTTLGLSGNQCQYLEKGFDSSYCTEYQGNAGIPDQAQGDEVLVSELVKALDNAPDDKPIFAWVHFMDAHDPYQATNHVFEFYPYTYTGELDPGNYDQLEDMILQGESPTQDELEYFQAVYASQVRGVDDKLGYIVQSLKDRDLYDSSLIVTGIDHGEELYQHNEYPYHGCSPYQDVLATTWSFKLPGLIPEGQVLESWASVVDVTPTIADVAGLKWEGPVDGESLVSQMMSGAEAEKPVYFERDPEMAGVIMGDHKYFLTTEPEYASCEPFVGAQRGFYTTENEALFDLMGDPGETENLVLSAPETRDELRQALCSWIMDGEWLNDGNSDRSKLVQACRE